MTKPLKVFLSTIGTRGDVQPLVALGKALVAAGHSVTLNAPCNFASFVADAGLPFAPMEIDFDAFAAEQAANINSNLKTSQALNRVFAEQIVVQFRDLPAQMKGHDVVVAASAQMVAGSVAADLGIPYRYLIFVPTVLPSSEYPPFLVPWQRLPGFVNRALWWGMAAMYNQLLRKKLNAGRAQLGLAGLTDVASHITSDHTIVACDAGLGAIANDVVQPFTQTGAFVFGDVGDALPERLEKFLQAGAPPVYIGFGSMPSADPKETSRIVRAAVAAAGVRAVVYRGAAQLGDVDDDTLLGIDAVSHRSLFPRCAAVVHHGGAGTTTAAARAGVPHVVVPHVSDQFFWAERTVRLGIGGTPIPRPKLNAERLALSIREALRDDVRARARALGQSLDGVDGLKNAVRCVESARRG
ncbi:MAG: glycosyltransferase [Deltaproteobacteria bacterium]|nr:glycosyltransferase [Deltaproteobacteria bacterium]